MHGAQPVPDEDPRSRDCVVEVAVGETVPVGIQYPYSPEINAGASPLAGGRAMPQGNTEKSPSQLDQRPQAPIELVGDQEAPDYNHEDNIPDGGYHAWLCVMGGWCALFCTFGLLNCAGVFVQYYSDGPLRDLSVSTVTWITSLQAFTMDMATAVMGRIFDSYGHRWLLYCGTVVFVFGIMMTSLATEYYQYILAQGVVAPVGCSAISTTVTACIMTWFKQKRGTALGLAVSGSAAGGVVLPIMMMQLIPRVSFPWTMRIMGMLFFALCAIACVTVTSRLKPKPERLQLGDYTRPWAEPTMTLIFAACFFFFFGGMFVPFSYILVQAEHAGTDPVLVEYLLSIMNASSIPGRIVPGLIADLIGRFNTTILFLGISAISTLTIWLPGVSSTPALIVYVVLFGFSSGCIFNLAPAVIAQVSSIREIGTRTGIAFAVGGTGALIAPFIAGIILERMNGNYLGLQLYCGFSMVLAMVLFAAGRYLQAGFKPVKV